MLQPLTINDYTLKDSFDAANKIKNVPSEMFEEGYQFVSFDIESLFTNVPLNINRQYYFRSDLSAKVTKNKFKEKNNEKPFIRLMY